MSDPPSSLVIRPWSFVLRPWSFVLSPSLLAPGFVRLSRGSQHDGPRDTGQRTKDRGPKTKDGFPTTGHKPSGGYQCQIPRFGKAPTVGTPHGTRTVPWLPIPIPIPIPIPNPTLGKAPTVATCSGMRHSDALPSTRAGRKGPPLRAAAAGSQGPAPT